MNYFLRITLSLLTASMILYSCSSEEVKGGEEPVQADTIKYELKHVSDLSTQEYVDSMCSVEPMVKDYIGFVKSLLSENLRLKIIDYIYESSDGKGGKTKLSAQLIVPTIDGRVTKEYLILDNRATQMADRDVPTNKLFIGSVLALTGSPVVTADLLGYGTSISLPFSYICRHTAAVNTVDAALVAQQMLHSKWLGLNLNNKVLPLLSEGYSQGGYDALAVQRYLETEASKEVRDQLPLKKTRCGAGAYNPRDFLKEVLTWEDYRYSPYIVACIIGYINYHPELFPKGFTINDVLSEKLRKSDLVAMINSRQYDNEEIKGYVADYLGGDVRVSDILSEDLINPETELHKSCLKAAEYDGLLQGWNPIGPIDFFHARNDDCVPVQCTYAAEEAFRGCDNLTFQYLDTPAVPGLHSMSYITFITNILIYGW